MKKELEHFRIGTSYGGNQDWFRSFMMRLGGCAAETACDSSVYFALHRGYPELYPFDAANLTQKEYVDFAHMMERYLWPRMSGVDRMEIFVDGYGSYMRDRGVTDIRMDMFSGREPLEKAAAAVVSQIDQGWPIPTLILNHKYRAYKDYVWHWFLVNGYDFDDNKFMVKAVTYSGYQWLDLAKLWDTGYERRGGLILYSKETQKADHEQ